MSVNFVSTHDNGTTGSGPVVVAGIPGGTDRLYILTAGAQNGGPRITSVTGGGLTWIDLQDQCGGRNQTMIDCWFAIGSPGAFSATVTIDTPDDSFSCIVDVFDGAEPTGPITNETSQNTNGVGGACSGGTDDDFPLGSITVNNPNASIAFAAVSVRNKGLTQDVLWTTRGNRSDGVSGDETEIFTATKGDLGAFDPTSPVPYAPLSNDVDWVTLGFEIVAAGVTMRTFSSIVLGMSSGLGIGVYGVAVQYVGNPVATKWINVMINTASIVVVNFDIMTFTNSPLIPNINLRFNTTAAVEYANPVFSFPLDIGPNTGISMRISDDRAPITGYGCSVLLSDRPFNRGLQDALKGSGTKSAGFAGPVSGAGIQAFGPFVELISAIGFTPNWGSFQWFGKRVGGTPIIGLQSSFEIATGPAGNETVQIGAQHCSYIEVGSGKNVQASYDLPIIFPSAARVSVRCRDNTAEARNYSCGCALSGA